MLRTLKSKAQGSVGIPWMALAEYSQMSTHVPGFQTFFRFLHHFILVKISHQEHKVFFFVFKELWITHSSFILFFNIITRTSVTGQIK